MAGATTIEINGVPVSTTAPFPVTLVAGGGGQSNVNVSQFGGQAVGPAIAQSGAGDETQKAILARAQVVGQDLVAAANSKAVPISADQISAVFNTGRNPVSIEALWSFAQVTGVTPTGSLALAIAAYNSLAAKAYTDPRLGVDSIMRGDDGATYSAVGTRPSGSGTLAVGTLQRLLVDAYARGYDLINNVALAESCYPDIVGVPGLKGVYEGRARGYWASRQGRRYVCKSPNLTGVAAATSFVSTTPTFLIVCGATKAIVVRRIKANLPLVGTSTTFRMLVKTDTANRFSAGGTARAPQTMNGGNIVATGLAQNLEAPTATAEGGGTKDIDCDSNQLVAGSECVFEAEDGLIIPANGSLLVYVVTATAGATIDYTIEFEEAQVQ